MIQKNKVKIAIVILLTMIIAMFQILNPMEVMKAEAAACPGMTDISYVILTGNQCGCRFCGGIIKYDSDNIKEEEAKLTIAGSGIETRMEDGWLVYYRCHNCGVTGQYTDEIKRELLDANGNVTWSKSGSGVRGPGYVPWYRCTACEATREGSPYVPHKTFPDPTATPTPTLKPTNTPTPKPAGTPTPTATPKPGAPTNTPTPKPTNTPKPTSTPVPTATPAPTATPKPGTEISSTEYYFTTDAGYCIDTLIKSESYGIAGNSSDNSLSVQLGDKRTESYRIGLDSSGNYWYFKLNSETLEADYVHPYLYKGVYVGDNGLKKITELSFPDTLSYGGKTYTVVSIGGEGDRYALDYSSYSGYGNFYSRSERDAVKGIEHLRNTYVADDTANTGNYSEKSLEIALEYLYGCMGTGYIKSYKDESFSGYNIYNYSSSYSAFVQCKRYYVYNTTLQSITIPDTVTSICDGAFYGCQALSAINGGNNVQYIGEYAFAGAAVTTAQRSTYAVDSSGKTRRYEYYYNEERSYTELTAIMSKWENSVRLSSSLGFPAFPLLKTLGTYSFSYHRNLTPPELPESLTMVAVSAFHGSALESITFHNATAKVGTSTEANDYQTLGTRGTGDARTVVYADKDSTAASYVSMYSDYYVLGNAKPPFEYAEVYLTPFDIRGKCLAVTEEEELPVLEDWEYGTASHWFGITVTGCFEYLTIEIPWENGFRTVFFDAGNYDEETNKWTLPGNVTFGDYRVDSGFTSENGADVIFMAASIESRSFYPVHIAEWTLPAEIVVFPRLSNERKKETPGYNNEVHTLYVRFYGEGEGLLQTYQVGLKLVPYSTWRDNVVAGRADPDDFDCWD